MTKNLYHLPFKKSDLTKAHSDPRAHFAHFKHAMDFILPEGTEILAPRNGTVLDLKVDSSEGGPDPKYNDTKYVNYITLQHSHGEYSQYVHLKHNGALVKVGDEVKTRQPIALSGNTGFTTEPHLHFQVFKHNQTRIGWETLRVRFREGVDIDRTQAPIPKEYEEIMRELDEYRRRLRESSQDDTEQQP